MHRRETAEQFESAGPANTHGRLSNVFVRALANVLHQRGLNREALMPAADRGDPAWVHLSEFARIFSRAVALADDPALGLLCGAIAIEPSFDVVGTLVAHTSSIRHAIEVTSQFHPLLIEGAALHFDEHAGRAQLRCEFPRVEPTLDRGLAELGAAGLWRMLLALGADRDSIHAVSFTHERPRHHAAYSAIFAGRERFEQPFTGLAFTSAALDRPNPHYQPELLGVLKGQAERSLDRLARGISFVERVETALRRQPAGSIPDMKPVARELGLSVRSLRRRLDEEGTSFRVVSRAALETAARTMLRQPSWTVQATSHALGFRHVTTFHRAFKRWTGLTPQEYRNSTLGVESAR
ncbi:MAG: AraC family transcriptional regulator ligand-binding domain-containing protein [Polyangiales bacterium]